MSVRVVTPTARAYLPYAVTTSGGGSDEQEESTLLLAHGRAATIYPCARGGVSATEQALMRSIHHSPNAGDAIILLCAAQQGCS